MSTERLPSGGWRCRWRDAKGNERSKGSRTWRKRDAEAYERKMLNTRNGVVSDLTVREVADAWLAASRHLADTTRYKYRQELDHDILPVLGDVKIVDLSSAHIDAYIAGMAAAGRAATSQRRHLKSLLSPMCTYARRRGLIIGSPTVDVNSPRVEDKEMRFLSIPELRRLSAAFPERYQNLILFTGIMGPRWGEVWKMTPGDVSGAEVLIRGTKSKSSLRRVIMPAFVQKVVVAQMEQWATPGCLWANEQGVMPNASWWRKSVWKPSLKRSGLAHLRFHDLRHTAVALAIEAGGNPLLVQKRMGHGSINVTLGLYGHLFPGADASVADKLDELW
jgi:integrase